MHARPESPSMQDTNGYTNGYVRGVSESRAGCGSVHLFSLVPSIAENPPIGALQCYCSPTSRALPVSGTIAIRCHTLCCAPGDTTRVTKWWDSRRRFPLRYIPNPVRPSPTPSTVIPSAVAGSHAITRNCRTTLAAFHAMRGRLVHGTSGSRAASCKLRHQHCSIASADQHSHAIHDGIRVRVVPPFAPADTRTRFMTESVRVLVPPFVNSCYEYSLVFGLHAVFAPHVSL